MYTSEKRVIKDGYLVAFEGEVMSDEDAVARGLVNPTKAEPKPKAKAESEPESDAEDEAEAEPEAEPEPDQKPKTVKRKPVSKEH